MVNHIKLMRNRAREYLSFDERIKVIELLSKDLGNDLIENDCEEK